MFLLRSLLLLSIFVIISSSETLSSSSKCSLRDHFTVLFDCSPILKQLKSPTNPRKKLDLCEQAEVSTHIKHAFSIITFQKCLALLTCEEAEKAKAVMVRNCEFDINEFPDARQCFVGFLKNVYLEQTTKKQGSYLYNYGFLDVTHREHRKYAFVEGQQCFLDYVKDNCDEFSFDYLSSNLPNIMRAVSKNPLGNDCKHTQGKDHQLNFLECVALQEETESRIQKLTTFNTYFSGYLVEDAYKVCKDAQKCFSEHSCLIPSFLRYKFSKICDDLQERI
ncbi:hypothetical protein CRE_08928 [Caenorhabditis remanei]|uniref:T20D4.11-like domain-containing protein n=1 Tax=Caenorhabditis remanei TaxID=31234 RepID=E3LIB7_CAERE|nr:hypothetical protein CRE_08928 [Caenorhabditis remanei]